MYKFWIITNLLLCPRQHLKHQARETLLILVNSNDIVLQGQKVANVETVLEGSRDIIDGLEQELAYHNKKQGELAGATDSVEGELAAKAITIMGDRAVPYALLKKIMYTCAEAGYTDVSLAVEQHLEGEGEV